MSTVEIRKAPVHGSETESPIRMIAKNDVICRMKRDVVETEMTSVDRKHVLVDN